jgi:hypothetical protein
MFVDQEHHQLDVQLRRFIDAVIIPALLARWGDERDAPVESQSEEPSTRSAICM